MGHTVFIISDTHFGHANILEFTDRWGEPLRSFSSVEEMDEHMVSKWNSVVRPQDHIYHLGDVALKKNNVEILRRCNGHKRLVRGNHDIYSTKFYMQFFDEIYGVRVFEDLILSHIPIHPASIKNRWLANVHGHLHRGKVEGEGKYFNASVEMLDYTPISLEQLRDRLRSAS
jgi:calcineurin-like phosphoesterase family protein